MNLSSVPLLCLMASLSAMPQPGNGPGIWRLVCSGTTAYIAREQGTVECVNLRDRTEVWKKRIHDRVLEDLTIESARSELGASASISAKDDYIANIKIWRCKDGSIVRSLSAPLTPRCVAFGKDEKTIFVGGYKDDGLLWRWRDGEEPDLVSGFRASMVSRLVRDSDNSMLIAGLEGGSLITLSFNGRLGDAQTDWRLVPNSRVESVCQLAHEPRFLAGTEKRMLALVDLANQKLESMIEVGGSGLWPSDICRFESTYFACNGNELLILRVVNHQIEVVGRRLPKLGQINSIAVCEPLKLIVAGHDSGELTLWPIAGGGDKATFAKDAGTKCEIRRASGSP